MSWFFSASTATAEIYTLSLHDALPIYAHAGEKSPEVKVWVPTRISFWTRDRKSTRLNSSHLGISYAVFCLKKKMLDDYSDFLLDQGSDEKTQNLLSFRQ